MNPIPTLSSPPAEISDAERLQAVEDCLESIPAEAETSDYRQALLAIASIVRAPGPHAR